LWRWDLLMSNWTPSIVPRDDDQTVYLVMWSSRPSRFVVAGVAECVGEPIKNPVTGAEHRVLNDIRRGNPLTVMNHPPARRDTDCGRVCSDAPPTVALVKSSLLDHS
jgi:hypothetical protein